MISHVDVLGISMSVQRQDNEQSCIYVRCIDVCTDRTMSGHVYMLGVSMSVQRQDNEQSCICVRCIDVLSKTGQ